MTKDDLKAHLATLGWSASHLGRLLGLHAKTPQNWILDRNTIPADTAAWLQRRVAEHERMLAVDPPPTKEVK